MNPVDEPAMRGIKCRYYYKTFPSTRAPQIVGGDPVTRPAGSRTLSNLSPLSLFRLGAIGLALLQPSCSNSTETQSGTFPVVVVTDCGADMDDQFVLVNLLKSPRVDLKGIVA